MDNINNIWNNYLYFIFILGFIFFAISLIMLYWAIRNKQFYNLNSQANSIFDESEPIGTQTDFFPKKNLKNKKSL